MNKESRDKGMEACRYDDFGNPFSYSSSATEKKRWWLSNRKIVEKYVKDARMMMLSQDRSDIATALNLLDAALAISPRYEIALELKAKSLLQLRRYKEIADMFHEQIPSFRLQNEEFLNSLSENSLQNSSRDRIKLLPESDKSTLSPYSSPLRDRDITLKCFSIKDLKKKLLAGISKNYEKQGEWRYMILGEACSHLGMMEDAMVLLQTGKRVAMNTFRRVSGDLSDDKFIVSGDALLCKNSSSSSSELIAISNLLSHTKFLIRRKAAAISAFHVGLHSESIRHFSKILEGRRNIPQAFAADCYVHRAAAYSFTGRPIESIADCNRALALEPTSISALSTRAEVLESVRCTPECLRDLEHLKLLYDSILRDRKLPGPVWRRERVRYDEISSNLKVITAKIADFRKNVMERTTDSVDYYGLVGLRRGCSKSELERTYRLLSLRHKPDKATVFLDRCEFSGDNWCIESVKEQAKMSSLSLYRLIQKSYSSIMASIKEEEALERERQFTISVASEPEFNRSNNSVNQNSLPPVSPVEGKTSPMPTPISFQGSFCRDLAIVGSLLLKTGFNQPIPMKCEALSC